jgi:hypothetical protein
VLKFRRGILAAGLSFSVVGTMIAVAVVDAQAAPTTPVASAPQPPALLPWGARPATMRTGQAGTSSEALAAAGLSAAEPAQPGAQYAPKGNPAVSSASTTKALELDATNYFYNVGSQSAVTDGFYASVTIAKPVLGAADSHSLAELAVQSADGRQIVEVGWTVDPAVNGDANPHLFVYHWVNGAETCYNACGFVQVSTTVRPGATLPVGSAKPFGIQFSDNAWWISYDSEFIGYFPVTLWTGAGVASFSKSGLLQVFGEVASSSTAPCADMGNGLLGTNAGAATLGSITYTNGPTVTLNIRAEPAVAYYVVNASSTRTFQYGGPGAC